jgi:uncharacterized membrane protein YfcA
MILIPALLGAMVGTVMALTGAGGAVFSVPLLTVVLGLNMQQAAVISLTAIATSAGIHSIKGLMAGDVRYKAAMLIAACGLVAAPFGVILATMLPQTRLKVIYAGVLLYVAWLVWHRREEWQEAEKSLACQINPDTARFNWTMPCTHRMMMTGIGAGFLSGLLGVGGGFIIVPALHRISNLSHTSVLHTTVAAIAIISTGSLILHSAHTSIAWQVAIPFVLGMMVSVWLTGHFFRNISRKTSQSLFAGLALLAALAVLVA